MLTISRKFHINFLRKINKFCFAKQSQQFEVLDIKNSHLFYAKDPAGKLPYMSQIVTQQGNKGIVLKLQEKGITVIGMYNNVDKIDKIKVTDIKDHKQIIAKSSTSMNKVYDINLTQIANIKDVEQNRKMICQLGKQGKRSRLTSLSPILSVCNDIYVGDFANLVGPLGSGRTTNALNLLQCFTNSNIQNPVGIYLNTNLNDGKQTCTKAASQYNTLAFGRRYTDNKNANNLKVGNMSSVGVYILAVKCISIAKKMKQQGKNVMLVIDSMQEIISNQWTILQNLKLPISPFPILNSIYSQCSDGTVNKNGKKQAKGSLTALSIGSPQSQDTIQQYTKFGNNTKHLKTLSNSISHPLQLTVNNTKINSSPLLNTMRRKINKLVRQKKQSQLLMKLKLTKDQPWEHYFILDSDWWATVLKKYRPTSIGQRDLLLWFINANIEEDFCAHWNIGCIDAFNRYLDYLARPEDYKIGMEEQQFQNFIQICKSQRVFDVFKKDYLN